MQLPVIEGILDRRILLNYRIDPDCLKKFLPPPFTPRIHKGHAIGGVCMIRFKNLRPRHFPEFLGVNSENAAYRIAVEWPSDGQTQEGVYIPKRDTASRFNSITGGRVFPGVFNHCTFKVEENEGHYHVEIAEHGEPPHVVFDGEEADEISEDSIFSTLDEASDFFEKGPVGFSCSREAGHYDGMELRLLEWKIAPLKITNAYVKLYEDETIFPKGTVQLDSALIMKKLKHEWHNMPSIGPA